MSAKQSGPTAVNSRTRACSGSDLLSSSSGGANGTAGGGGALTAAARRFPAQVPNAHQLSTAAGAAAASAVPRSRCLCGAVRSVASAARAAQSSFSIPNSSGGPYGSQDSVHSSPEGGGGGREHRSTAPGDWLLTSSPLAAHVWRCCISISQMKNLSLRASSKTIQSSPTGARHHPAACPGSALQSSS
nr:E3 ubiquitin-protein ligase ZNRF2-like [Macaca nemestrina]